jgi:hypothetical protein
MVGYVCVLIGIGCFLFSIEYFRDRSYRNYQKSGKPPLPIRKISPGKIEVYESSGCLSFFGIPFIIFGLLALLLAGTGIITFSSEGSVWIIPAVVGAAIGLICTVFGFALFLRRWILLDVTHGTVKRQTGLIVPLVSRGTYLTDYQNVLLKRELRGSDVGVIEIYPVFLKVRGNKKDLKLFSPVYSDYQASREFAAYMSDFLHLPFLEEPTPIDACSHPIPIKEYILKITRALKAGKSG